jgi:hypothetical protein
MNIAVLILLLNGNIHRRLTVLTYVILSYSNIQYSLSKQLIVPRGVELPFKALAIAWPASKPLGPLYRRASSGPIRLRCSGNKLHTSKLRCATERQQPLKSQTTLQICNRTKNAIKELDPAAASQNITRFQDEWLPRNIPRNPSSRDCARYTGRALPHHAVTIRIVARYF